LQGLGEHSITQGDVEYSANNFYEITFTPYSASKTYPLSILMSYPATVTPDESAITGGCTVKAGATTSVSS